MEGAWMEGRVGWKGAGWRRKAWMEEVPGWRGAGWRLQMEGKGLGEARAWIEGLDRGKKV